MYARQSADMTPASKNLVLGVDGGGTNTRALLATAAGEVIGRGAAAGSNPRAVGFSAATAAIRTAIDEALASAGLSSGLPSGLPAGTRLGAICLGIAGVGRPPHKAEMEAWIRATGLAERTLVVNDIEPILAAGTPDGWGVALICGTGSSCFARSPSGERLQVGGWGYLLGDEGSGYDIALRALRLATQTADGRANAHALLAAILAEWGLKEPGELITHVYEGGLGRPELAALTRPLLALVDAGEKEAQALIDRAATDLAHIAKTAARRLGLTQPPLALSGGLFASSVYLRERLSAHLGAGWGRTTLVTDPAQGTVILARRLLDA